LVREYRASVTFVSTCQGRPEYRFDDSVVAAETAATLPSDVLRLVTVDQESRSPYELQEFLTCFDLAIATRMHMAILSLNAGTPVLPIAYEFKTRELFRVLEMEEWCLDIDKLTPSLLSGAVGGFIESLPSLTPPLMRRVGILREECSQTAKVVREAYEKRPARTTNPANRERGGRSDDERPGTAARVGS